MLMVITPLMCLEFIDPAVPFLAELTVEGLAGFTGGLCLDVPSDTERLAILSIAEIVEWKTEPNSSHQRNRLSFGEGAQLVSQWYARTQLLIRTRK